MNDLGSEDGDRLARQLDWNLLRTFVVIVQEGGITAAANRLLLKQPTVSNALKRLEDRIGKKLIDRGPGHFRVTDAGDTLYRESIEIYGSIARLTVAVRDIHDAIRGHVSIALASHVIFPAFDETLREFSQRHQLASYDISVATSAEVTGWVLEKRASFGICLVHQQHPKLTYTHMYRQHFGFFCGPGHRLFGRPNLTLEDLAGEPSVSFGTDQLHDALRPVALLRAQVGLDDTIRATSPHLEEVRRLITAGVGIGPLPIHVVKRDVEDGILWQLPPYEDPPEIDIYLVVNPTARLNRAEQGFIDSLTARVQALPLDARHYT
ncbi:LysR family transcriptional regulator [Rhodospirillaceae bacterium KN72]|uniref:LysR family transcriptional regulator n=1 Tax=Pacificispira spongiicola TaxID=2729598 RepID=A0A7Y0DXK5_9PROT|nr:LysR family transcriptional regulator [Pacificispira spongiicola]NMM43308.1 LysR family transcriptional regulator [Pacificispira spongiicola]